MFPAIQWAGRRKRGQTAPSLPHTPHPHTPTLDTVTANVTMLERDNLRAGIRDLEPVSEV